MNTKKVSEIEVSYKPITLDNVAITSSIDSYKVLLNHWDNNTIQLNEEVKLILLNRSNHVLGIYPLAKGGISECVVDVRIILSIALKTLATGIILAHNHPSGKLVPSKSDIALTDKLKKACELLNIQLLDHLIISKWDYYSFADDSAL